MRGICLAKPSRGPLPAPQPPCPGPRSEAEARKAQSSGQTRRAPARLIAPQRFVYAATSLFVRYLTWLKLLKAVLGGMGHRGCCDALPRTPGPRAHCPPLWLPTLLKAAALCLHRSYDVGQPPTAWGQGSHCPAQRPRPRQPKPLLGLHSSSATPSPVLPGEPISHLLLYCQL